MIAAWRCDDGAVEEITFHGVLLITIATWLLFALLILASARRAAEQQAGMASTARTHACNAMYAAALEGRVVLTPRDEAYCRER